MSKTAPWLAISVDTFDSEMFDDSAMGIRLAWVCLLMHAKAQGRAGKVRFRDKAFANQYRLNSESVSEMLVRAEAAGAIARQGDVVIVANWKSYQDPGRRTRDGNDQEQKDLGENGTHFTKTPATRDQRPETNQRSPSTKRPETGTAQADSGSSGRLGKSSFVNLSMNVLQSLPKFRIWIEQEKRRRDSWIGSTDDEQFALAAREKAISDGTLTSPVAWFTATMPLKKKNPTEAWNRIRGKHEDAAKQSERGERKHHYADLIAGIGKDASQL